MTQTKSEGVKYTSYTGSHRWSDAASKCNSQGAFLAKIKNLDDIGKARQAFMPHHNIYWVGVKYDESLNDFVWVDDTRVVSNPNFEAIVNRDEQGEQGFSKRCLYVTNNEDVLVADGCNAHKMYICQVGESDDPVTTSK